MVLLKRYDMSRSVISKTRRNGSSFVEMKPRSPVKLIDLIMILQGSRSGITLAYIEERFECSYRTAQRMLGDVLEIVPVAQLIEEGGGREEKRWRIANLKLKDFAGLTGKELSALAEAGECLRGRGQLKSANVLSSLEAKIRNLVVAKEQKDVARTPYYNEAKAPTGPKLITAELDADEDSAIAYYTQQTGPRYSPDQNTMETIKQAISEFRVLNLYYHDIGHKEPAGFLVYPFGFLVGRFTYLVGFTDPRSRKMKQYRVDRILGIEMLDRTFVRPTDTTIQSVVAKSFGDELEEPILIKLRFTALAAHEAKRFEFHPTQTLHERSDGKLDVELFAGGLKEICWELFRWGDGVEILEPLKLKEEMTRQLSAASGISG
jgi:predicted DNA-binding transcriptional regulator YafY